MEVSQEVQGCFTSRHDGEEAFEAVSEGHLVPVAEAGGLMVGTSSSGDNFECQPRSWWLMFLTYR